MHFRHKRGTLSNNDDDNGDEDNGDDKDDDNSNQFTTVKNGATFYAKHLGQSLYNLEQ